MTATSQDAGAPESYPRLMSLAGAVSLVERAPAEESPNLTDQQITVAHLLDSALHHMAHTLQHLERLEDPAVQKDPAALAFNLEHAEHHADSTQEHLVRVSDWLREHPSDPAVYKAQKDALDAHKTVQKNENEDDVD